MTSVDWTGDELERIGGAEELRIAPLGPDRAPRRPVPIWVVRAGKDLYVRSWRGTGGGWFRAAKASRAARISAGGIEKDVALLDAGDDVNDAVDAAGRLRRHRRRAPHRVPAYRAKYGRYPSYVEPMVRAQARATTLKLMPRSGEDRS